MKKNVYLILAVFGVLLPYTQFVPWTNTHGFNISLMLAEMFANQIATGIAIDALLTAVGIIVFILFERREIRVKHLWLPIVGIFLSGISFAFPIYLYLRERTREENLQKNG